MPGPTARASLCCMCPEGMCDEFCKKSVVCCRAQGVRSVEVIMCTLYLLSPFSWVSSRHIAVQQHLMRHVVLRVLPARLSQDDIL